MEKYTMLSPSPVFALVEKRILKTMSMDLQKLATYPFRSAAKDWIKREGISVEEILYETVYARARHIGRLRVEGALEKSDVGERSLATETDCIMEICSYPVARMITASIADPFLTGRYALSESLHAAYHLKDESEDMISAIAAEIDLDIRVDDGFALHFTEYLKYSPTHHEIWKLVNRPLKGGWVPLQKKDMIRLLREALSDRIFDEITTASSTTFSTSSGIIRDAMSDDIFKIKNMLSLQKQKTGKTKPAGIISIVRFPPCMKKILAAIQSGANIPHVARFTLVTFLNGIGLTSDQILNLFATAPDFNKGKSRYQVEHITGKLSGTEYTAPKCESLQTWGLCPGKDDLCKTIVHPLSYYRKKRVTETQPAGTKNTLK